MTDQSPSAHTAFVECDTCRKKPGTPPLCRSCQSNRAMIKQLQQRIEELEGDLADHRKSFDLRWDADMRAIKRWQVAHPGAELRWPDHADLVVWMLEQLDAIVRPCSHPEGHRFEGRPNCTFCGASLAGIRAMLEDRAQSAMPSTMPSAGEYVRLDSSEWYIESVCWPAQTRVRYDHAPEDIDVTYRLVPPERAPARPAVAAPKVQRFDDIDSAIGKGVKR